MSSADEIKAPSPASPAPSEKPLDCREAVTKAAETCATLWLSYTFFLFYLLVATAGVSHHDLFVENGVKLPILGADLPLKDFFRAGPALFLVAHAYILLHLALLADEVRQCPGLIECSNGTTRRTLPINLFVELLARPGAACWSAVGLMVSVVIWATLIIGPVLLLVFFQLQFLAYHDQLTTNIQRGAVLADLALLWVFWPNIIDRVGNKPFTRWRVRWLPFYGLTIGTALLVLIVATFPGETFDDLFRGFPLRETLVAGQVDELTSRPASLWMNRLVLPGLDLTDHKANETEKQLYAARVLNSVRGRHLEGAVLIDAILPRTDFSNSHLEGATFARAKLQGSWFDATTATGAIIVKASMLGASLFEAKLQGASFDHANLHGAAVAGAWLGGALLSDAQLQGASLAGADLRGAALTGSDLRGANLAEARLEGATLNSTRLAGASFVNAAVWRADFHLTVADPPGVRSNGVDTTSAAAPCATRPKAACNGTDDVDAVQQTIKRFVIDSPARDAMLGRLRPNLDPNRTVHGEAQLRTEWRRIAPRDPNSDAAPIVPAGDPPAAVPSAAEAALLPLWKDIACTAEGAPFVLASFVETWSDTKAWRFQKRASWEDFQKYAARDAGAGKPARAEYTQRARGGGAAHAGSRQRELANEAAVTAALPAGSPHGDPRRLVAR